MSIQLMYIYQGKGGTNQAEKKCSAAPLVESFKPVAPVNPPNSDVVVSRGIPVTAAR